MIATTTAKAAAAALWLAAVGGSLPAQNSEGVARLADARSQIRHAAGVRREGRGARGDDRIENLKRTAEAYDAVLRFFPEAKAECAEAAFRLGETRRSLGDREGALAAFGRVVEIGAHRRFSARALLEIGHLHRRAKEAAKAIETYGRVAAEYGDEAAYRDDAYTWMGKVHAAARDAEAARTAWTKVAEEGADATDRIRAFDLVAGSYLGEGKNAEAAATIDRCRALFSELSEDASSRGARVKRALAGMKSVRRLTEALGVEDPDPDPEDPEPDAAR